MTEPATEPLQLAAALADVRRAWRTVVAYQQRVNEIFYQFHLAMTKNDLAFLEWGSHASRRVKNRGTRQFEPNHSAWSLFPGMSMYATWQRVLPLPVQYVWMGLYTDTACGAAGSQSDPNPDPFRFADVEGPTSKTEIWFGLQTCGQPNPNWADAWDVIQPHWKETVRKDFPWSTGSHSGVYRSFGVPVETLVSADAVDHELVRPVLDWFSQVTP